MTVTNSTTGSTRTPSFTFVSNENAKFKCAIDDTRLYEPCGEGLTGKYTARNVPDGRHAFFVQGTDKYNVGPHVRFLFTIGKCKYFFKQRKQPERVGSCKRRYQLFHSLK